MSSGELILYITEDGKTSVQLKAQEETVWLTRTEIAELFQMTPQNVTLHIKEIYTTREAEIESTSKDYLLVQNKMLWAATHHTAPELIVERSNSEKPNMGLKSWKGSRVRQQDVTVAKNYLEKPEIEELNQVVVMYLDYAENQAKNRKTVTMAEWEQKLDAFLIFNEKDLLNHAGKVSAEVAEKTALDRYTEFDERRRQEDRQIADAEDFALLEAFTEKAKQLEAEPRV